VKSIIDLLETILLNPFVAHETKRRARFMKYRLFGGNLRFDDIFGGAY
jgi:hypothetical protein